MSNGLLPCKTCPWRMDKDATTIPRYDPARAEHLINTVGDGDGMRPIMACHCSPDANMRACNGYLARAGWSNINVRFLLLHGRIHNPARVLEACEEAGIELEPDYPTVLEKLRRSTQ